jgi:hypothetical protein
MSSPNERVHESKSEAHSMRELTPRQAGVSCLLRQGTSMSVCREASLDRARAKCNEILASVYPPPAPSLPRECRPAPAPAKLAPNSA